MEVFGLLLAFVKATWWFFTPLILFNIAKQSWLYSRHVRYYGSLEYTLLEIRLPPDVLKTPKAMEYVLVGMHGVWDELKWRDIWIKGEVLPWFSLEIAGSGGDIHFYIFTQKKFKDFVESQVYAQYPEAEIAEVEDYTDKVPPNLPNKSWDVWATDLALIKPNPYPLRSYVDFEEMVEERRLDPIASISEILNKLHEGEHIWIQILIEPTFQIDELRKEGDKVIGKLMGRKVEEKKGYAHTVTGAFNSAAKQMLRISEEEKSEDPFASTEWRLTPGEREVLKKIDQKTAKVAFYTKIRFVYIGKKDVFNRANVGALFGYFRQFNTYDTNAFKPESRTLKKRSFIHFKKLRAQFRMLRIVQWYKWRQTLPGGISNYFILNVEELATIFHLPGLIVKAPMMPRVESRKVAPPSSLPVEKM